MKKIRFSILFTLFIFSRQYFSQTILWAQQVTGETAEQPLRSLTDTAGNTYIMGMLTGSIDFDPGIGSSMITSQGGSDVYLAKYNSAGEYLWSRAISGTGAQNAGGLLIDRSGDILVCGNFTGKTDANPDWETHFIDAGIQQRHGFIIKLSGNGQFKWATHITGNEVYLTDIAQGDEAYFVTGSFYTNIDLAPGVPAGFTHSIGDEDAVLFKLNAEGNVEWGKTIGGTKRDRATALTCVNGNVVIGGTFRDSLDIDPNTPVVKAGTTDSTAIFLLSLKQTDGEYVTHGSMSGTETATVHSIRTAPDGRIVVAGIFKGAFDFDPQSGTDIRASEGGSDVFVLGTGSSLHLGWAGTISGPGSQDCRGLHIDPARNIFLAGSFTGLTDFDPTEYEVKRTSAGGSDIFLLELNEHGNLLCHETIGGLGNDGAAGVSADAAGNLYLSGYYGGQFIGDTDIDPSGSELLLPSYTSPSDLFIAGFQQCTEPVGFEEPVMRHVILYPNPAANETRLSGISLPATLRIFDAGGRLVRWQRLTTPQFSIVDLPAGIYHLRCSDETSEAAFRLIKE